MRKVAIAIVLTGALGCQGCLAVALGFGIGAGVVGGTAAGHWAISRVQSTPAPEAQAKK